LTVKHTWKENKAINYIMNLPSMSKSSEEKRGADNIRMDLREIRWKGVDWMHLTQDRDQ